MENFSKKAFEIYDPLNVCLNNDLAFADNYYDVTYCTEAEYRLDQVLVQVMNSLIEQQHFQTRLKRATATLEKFDFNIHFYHGKYPRPGPLGNYRQTEEMASSIHLQSIE